MSKLTVILLFLVNIVSYAQMDENPVKWTTTVERISDEEIELVSVATLDDQWHIYSQKIEEGGPVPTSFSFRGDQRYMKKGNTKEGTGSIIDDEIFEMRIKYFNDQAVFTQRVRLKTNEKFVIKGTVEFMACSKENCFPPEEVNLSFNIN